MLAGVHVLAGPARCGKTGRLLEQYRRVLAERPLASALWLSPTHRAVSEIRQALLDGELGGCFQPQCLTFDQFARRVLDASTLPTRSIGPSLVRHIVGQLIGEAQEQDELRYFGPIAATRGFLDLVVGTIQEFKRLEIWPEELAQAVGRRPSQKDRELLLLYERYQQRLTAHHLYDAQGRFWQARALLRAGQQKPFERLRHVLVDGFTDFTRTEHEMLQMLAGRVESLTITLPMDDGQQRPDLFLKTAATLERLKSYHPQLQVDRLPRRRGTWAAMDHLEQYLFANPHHAPAAEDGAGIEIVPAASDVQELETIARRIKALLVRGDQQGDGRPVPAQDIVVVFRSLADVAETAHEIFAQFGVPVAIGSQQSLGRSPLAAALTGWLRLELDDWPFRQALAMLGHNGFCPDWPERNDSAVMAAQQTIYALQIPSGKDELLAGVDRLAQGDTPRGAAAREARPLLERMAQMLDQLPDQAPLTVWREAIVHLAAAIGMLSKRPISDEVRAGEPADRDTWDALLTALAAHDQLGTWLGDPLRAYTLEQFYEHLVEMLRSEPLPGANDETGRVRVLSAEQARNLSTPYVFLAGLSEKAFPPAAREDCVLGEADTARLIRAGLPLLSHADRPRFEMLLFYEVATRATRRLVLSYPALDARAQPLSPSPYLTELEQTFGAGCLARLPIAELSSVPASDEVLSLRELRVRAVSRALDGQTQLLERLCQHPAGRRSAVNLLTGLEVQQLRKQEAFGPFDGVLGTPAAGNLLAKRFGDEHCWSPSQLEQYAYCPYQFLLAQVLRMEPLEELEFEADHRGRGQMLHWLLSTLHRQWNSAGKLSTPGASSEGAFRAVAEALVGQFVEQAAARGALREGMLQIDARRVSAWLGEYHAQHRAYEESWSAWETPLRPAHFEVAFGPRRRLPSSGDEPVEEIDPLSTEVPYELDCGGETIRFAGRIDRIDLGQIGRTVVFNIVDYKSGKPSKRTSLDSVLAGRSLQLPLYALAARELLAQQGALPYRAAYWHVAGEGYREKDAIKFHLDSQGNLELTPEWEQLEKDLKVRVKSLVDGIRQGQFPMVSHDDECTSRCAYRTVCRVNQVRSLGKQWQPPGEPS